MSRFLIEVRHDDEYEGCLKALHAIDQLGSHFVTQAEWGCRDGVHRGWLIAELESRVDALRVLPPMYRGDARIVELNHFSRKDLSARLHALEA